MANSVDPELNTPSGTVWSGPALFAYIILSETLLYKILGHLPYCGLKSSFRFQSGMIFIFFRAVFVVMALVRAASS